MANHKKTTCTQLLRRSVRASALATLGLIMATSSALSAPNRIAVMSLIGDKLEVVYPQMATGSRLDQNIRHAIDDRAGEMDRFTLAAAEQEITAVDPAISSTLISMRRSVLHDQPDQLFDGKQAVLPGAVVDELLRVQAQYLLLITKHRDEVQLAFTNTRTGVGYVRGLGFYIDEHTRVQTGGTGEVADGLLAPFAYFRLSLVDVQTGLRVREQKVTLMQVLPVAGRAGVKEPWNVLDAKQKVAFIEDLIKRGLKEKMRDLLDGL